MAAEWGRWQAYEKTSITKLTYPSVARFTGHVQLKGVRPWTLEAYEMMLLLARWAGQDPAELGALKHPNIPVPAKPLARRMRHLFRNALKLGGGRFQLSRAAVKGRTGAPRVVEGAPALHLTTPGAAALQFHRARAAPRVHLKTLLLSNCGADGFQRFSLGTNCSYPGIN